MGRRNRSPVRQRSPEGPGCALVDPGIRTCPEPCKRPRSGSPPVGPGGAKGPPAALCFDRGEAGREASNSASEPSRNSSREQRGIGLECVCVRVCACVCVYRPELQAGPFGPEAPAVTLQDSAAPASADSQRSSAQTLFLANFSFSPLLRLPPSFSRLNASPEGTPKRKERKEALTRTSAALVALYCLPFRKWTFRYFLILLAPPLGQTEPFGPLLLFSKQTPKSASEESTIERFCTTCHRILLCTLENRVPSRAGVGAAHRLRQRGRRGVATQSWQPRLVHAERRRRSQRRRRLPPSQSGALRPRAGRRRPSN